MSCELWLLFEWNKMYAHALIKLTLRDLVIVEFIPHQHGLELWREEPVSIATVAKHHEMEGKDSRVDDSWPQDQTECSGKKVLSNHLL